MDVRAGSRAGGHARGRAALHPSTECSERAVAHGNEKTWLKEELAGEAGTARVTHGDVWRVMIDPHVLVLGLALGGSAGVSQALALWQPQMIKAFGLTNMEVGLLNGIPFAIAAVAMLAWGRRSDQMGERLWHTIVPLAFSSLALAATAVVHDLVPLILVLCLTLIGTYSMKGPFWALSAQWLAGPAAVVGLAQVNSIGNLAVVRYQHVHRPDPRRDGKLFNWR